MQMFSWSSEAGPRLPPVEVLQHLLLCIQKKITLTGTCNNLSKRRLCWRQGNDARTREIFLRLKKKKSKRQGCLKNQDLFNCLSVDLFRSVPSQTVSVMSKTGCHWWKYAFTATVRQSFCHCVWWSSGLFGMRFSTSLTGNKYWLTEHDFCLN